MPASRLVGPPDKAIGFIEQLAAGFCDERCADMVEHPLPALIGQRVIAIALGYEDLTGPKPNRPFLHKKLIGQEVLIDVPFQ